MPDEALINLIRLNGQKIDCERLQREAFLLSRCGADFQLTFVYSNGGPYSPEFATAWENARVGAHIAVKEEKTRHGTPYLVASRKDDDTETGAVPGLSAEEARSRLRKMAEVSDLVLELAAAYVFLKDEEHFGDNAIDELKVRKPLTARHDLRTQQAFNLLQELGLEIGDPVAVGQSGTATSF